MAQILGSNESRRDIRGLQFIGYALQQGEGAPDTQRSEREEEIAKRREACAQREPYIRRSVRHFSGPQFCHWLASVENTPQKNKGILLGG